MVDSLASICSRSHSSRDTFSLLILCLLVVYQHINHNVRKGKSIVTASFGPSNPQPLTALSPGCRAAQPDIKLLLDNDIPVFVTAGNDAQKISNGQLRTNVDTPPGLFEAPDFPIIVAGAVDAKRTPRPDSQRGPHVQLWAAGDEVQAQEKYSNGPVKTSGTSFSAPVMAGMLATYLAADEVPFHTDSGNLIQSAKQNLVAVINWQTQGIKTIWNEVDRGNNPPKNENVNIPWTSGPPPQTAPYAQGTCAIHVKQTNLNKQGD